MQTLESFDLQHIPNRVALLVHQLQLKTDRQTNTSVCVCEDLLMPGRVPNEIVLSVMQ